MLLRFALCSLIMCGPIAAQEPALQVRSDLECRLLIDGLFRGELRPGDGVRVALPPGEHRVEAITLNGGFRWEETVDVHQAGSQLLEIPLQAAIARAEVQRRGYWIAPGSRLIWAASDNGFGVSWSQAAYYCRALTTGGYSDWRLPTIDELHGLFGGPANQSGYHVTGPVKLTGWAWSSSPGKEAGEQWALDFGDGAGASVVMGDSGLNRALCVRHVDQ